MTQLKPILSQIDIPSTPGKFKADKSHPYYFYHRLRLQTSLPKVTLLSFLSLVVIVIFFFVSPHCATCIRRGFARGLVVGGPSSYDESDWENKVRLSAKGRYRNSHTVLVTGAAGFIGSHAAAALKKRGDGVVGLDNFNCYYDVTLKKERVKHLLDPVNVYVVTGDITDGDLLRRLFELVPFTHILHLAAQAGVRYAMQDPSSYIKSNVEGFVNVLEVAKSVNPQPAIVWASSSSVYGLNSKVPFSEDDRTDKPASLYAATKKAGEAIAHTYNHIHGLSITGLRFFTVYGPWGRPDMAYFNFTESILKKRTITIFVTPDDRPVSRDFTYIDDIVVGCLAALDAAEKSTGSGGTKLKEAQFRIINLASTLPSPVPKLVSILEKNLRKKAKTKRVQLPSNGDVPFTHADISLARKELGYDPRTDLDTGLKKFVKWYLEYHSKKKSYW